MRLSLPIIVVLLSACSGAAARAPVVAPSTEAIVEVGRAQASAKPRMEPFSFRSELVSAFAGNDVSFEAMVMTPAGYDPDCGWAVHYVIHGFGSSALRTAVGHVGDVLARDELGKAPPLVRVFLDANHPLGHHVFADSANMGPWATALVQELLPAIEARYGAIAAPAARFLSGHSSGGWSSLWLQVEHPEAFGGAWSLAPDPVDFRDFTNVDIHRFESMYRDPEGEPIPLVREGAQVVTTLEEFARQEARDAPVGRQIFYSFEAVFGPRAADGRPQPLFDRDTGHIDREVAEAWKHYDISAKLRREWPRLEPLLRGKLHVFVGLEDTYYLDGPVRLLADELHALGSDAELVLVPERDHVDLFAPHPELYPDGLLARVEDEMWASFLGSETRRACE